MGGVRPASARYSLTAPGGVARPRQGVAGPPVIPSHYDRRHDTHGSRAASHSPLRSPPHNGLANRGSTVRGRVGRLDQPAADAPAGVSRLWESRAARTTPATRGSKR